MEFVYPLSLLPLQGRPQGGGWDRRSGGGGRPPEAKNVPNLMNRMYPFFKSLKGITILSESSVLIYKKLDSHIYILHSIGNVPYF